ncbi:hypothetical protein LXL04_019134 [Taraxacum kok-saghyz]
MSASVQCRQEQMSYGETKKKEQGDDLSLLVDFNGVNLNMDLHQKRIQLQDISDSESENQLMPETKSIIIHGADDLSNSENKTADYDWLLSPPRNSVPSLEMEEQKNVTNGQSTSIKSKLEKPNANSIPTTKIVPKLPSSSIKPSNATIRRPSPSRKPLTTVSRSSTPTTKPSRSSTPTSRPTIPATKPLPPSKRSTTPTARSSTPTARSSIPTTIAKSASRSSTPTQRSTSVTKLRAPSVTKKSLPERPASATRGRPSVTEAIKPVPKRTSSSPSRGPVSSTVKTGVVKSRGYSNGNDDVNPVLMGTKMVERVVNMRKLAPPREDRVPNPNNIPGKLSVSQDNKGFGRSLSKKSFDMALRHLDIRRSMPGNMRASITKVPTSMVYSVRSESTKNDNLNASSESSSDH